MKFNNLLQKKVTRREFLAYLGIFFVSISGINAIYKAINGDMNIYDKFEKQEKGFGSGVYQGK